MKLSTVLGQLRILAIVEGISYLLLIPTVILKYGFDMGLPNKIVGGIHGILFILYYNTPQISDHCLRQKKIVKFKQ